MWKSVEGCAAYEVSDDGRVRSYYRRSYGGNPGARWVIGDVPRILSVCIGTTGYRQVVLRRDDGKWTVKISVLVAAAFIGQRPRGHVVRHGPGGQLDDSVGNLSYGTPRANANDRWRDGTMLYGETHPRARLDEQQAREIYRRAHAGEDQTDLGREFGVRNTTVSMIKNRTTWRSIHRRQA